MSEPVRTSSQSAADAIPGYADFLGKMTEAFKDTPLPPIFASGELFPTDHAWSFTHERQQYILGSPRFWKQLPVERSQRPAGLWGITIIDIDDERNSTIAGKIMGAIAAHLDNHNDG